MVKLDRLTRSVRDLGELVERYFAAGRWSLMSIGETIDTRSAAGRLVLNVLASVAQWERETAGERTSAAMKHKAAQREFTGGQAPYGYTLAPDGVHLVEEPAEQELLRVARELRQAGSSLRAIAIELDQRGLKSRRGKTFAPSQIRCLLRAA